MAFVKGDLISASEYNAHTEGFQTITEAETYTTHRDYIGSGDNADWAKQDHWSRSTPGGSFPYNFEAEIGKRKGGSIGGLHGFRFRVYNSVDTVILEWIAGEKTLRVVPSFPYVLEGTEIDPEDPGAYDEFDQGQGTPVFLKMALPPSDDKYQYHFDYDDDRGSATTGKYYFRFLARQAANNIVAGDRIKSYSADFSINEVGPVTTAKAEAGQLYSKAVVEEEFFITEDGKYFIADDGAYFVGGE